MVNPVSVPSAAHSVQSDEIFRLMVTSVFDYAIFILDPGGHVSTWNLGAERLKGYKADEIIGKHFSQFYLPEDREAGVPQKVLQTAVDTGHFEGEGWRVRQDGTRFWASVVVTALRDEAGNVYGFAKVTRDMTERKQLLDVIQQHARELEVRVAEREQSNAELEAFAYSVSHDLRAPLRAITGFAEALQEDYASALDDQARDYIHEITSAAERMSHLVQDLLEYGRVSRVNLPLESVRLRESVEEAVRQLGHIHGKLDIQVGADVQVRAHPQVLNQVILNLLSNAFKFHVKGATPAVKIWAEPRDGMVRVLVEDNGLGIAANHRERIWQVFERLHDRDTYPGTGIGLAIVKRAVSRLNGVCGVESEPGRGSTFWFEIPQGEGKERND